MKNYVVLLVIPLALGILFCGCAVTPEITQGQTNKESRLNIYDKKGYYQGYVKTLPSGRCQIFDKEGYYIGEARSN